MTESEQTEQRNGKKPGLWNLIVSVIGAAFGVQSSKTQNRDFSQKSPLAYIIAGILFGIVFVVTLVVIVNLVLDQV